MQGGQIDWEWFVRIWQILQQWLMIALLLSIIRWRKLFPFLTKESSSSLERKLFSFDEAYLPKVITDNEGIICNVNIAAEKLFGYKEKDLTGKSYQELIPEKDRDAFNAQLNTDDDEHEERVSLTMGLTKSKREFPAEVVFRKKRLNNELFYLVVIRDRTPEVIKAKKYEQYIEILKITIGILSKGEELSNTGSWLWDLKATDKTKAITASENYKKIVGLPTGTQGYGIDLIKPRVWDRDKKIVDDALEEAFKGNDYVIQYRMIRGTDFKVIHIRSKVRVFRDADGVVIAMYGSATLLKTENLSEASKIEEGKQ